MNEWLLSLLAAHLLLCAFTIARLCAGRAPLTLTHALWMLLLPFFGALSILSLARASGSEPSEGEWLKRQSEAHSRRLSFQLDAQDAVPLEEALLINDPRQRRRQMMNLLRGDPMDHLDLLLMARFNDDAETAHYATATITELQRQMQLELQRCQVELQASPDSAGLRREYVELLNRYCESGLIEGQALRRQRLVLSRALADALSLSPALELTSLAVRNHLALKEPAQAREIAEEAFRRWPKEEQAWFDMMRVCVETHDQRGFRALLERVRSAGVDFSKAGRERLQFWMEGGGA